MGTPFIECDHPLKGSVFIFCLPHEVIRLATVYVGKPETAVWEIGGLGVQLWQDVNG
jgi:hypothetical protein